MNRPLDAAVELARQGYACFPCRSNKLPTVPRDRDASGQPIDGTGGVKKASKDPDRLHELWRLYPGPLVGVATGPVSGIDLLDLDTARHQEATAWLEENRARIPATRTHQTGSGGLHLIFQADARLRNSGGKLAVGVDTRCAGGYLVWWPAAGCPVLCDASPAPWPSWLLELLMPPPRPALPRIVVPDSQSISNLIRWLAAARDGERNRATFWAACRAGEMVRSGLLSAEYAIALITEAATRTGLPRNEAERTARSGIFKS